MTGHDELVLPAPVMPAFEGVSVPVEAAARAGEVGVAAAPPSQRGAVGARWRLASRARMG